jgi:NodT family efflux transporter outer membrane factor (OMF) lipoprotein
MNKAPRMKRLFVTDSSMASGSWRLARLRLVAITLVVSASVACSTQRAYRLPTVSSPAGWTNASLDEKTTLPVADLNDAAASSWWRTLGDSSINTLIEATLLDNPTLQQATERVQQARAFLSVAHANQVPQLSGNGGVNRGTVVYPTNATGSFTILETSKVVGTSLAWEVDLGGRLRETARAASDRLDESNAAAAAARLSIAAQVARGVLNARACHYSLRVRDSDIASRELEMQLMHQRLIVGNVAPVDEANAATNLASARTARISQQQNCLREIDALVALSGNSADGVNELVMMPFGSERVGGSDSALPQLTVDLDSIIPRAPRFQPALPASILLLHPTVVSAEREVAATWSEIGVARAQRLPQLDLAAALSGNWLRVFGESLRFETWSIGATATAPLIDGGAGAAQVRGAQARYREAVAALQAALRSTAQDVEDALAEQQSAEGRVGTSRQELEAAVITLKANEERWRLGAISQFDLQIVRRQYTAAQQDAIDAIRDQAIAWVDLVVASNSNLVLMPDTAHSGVLGLPISTIAGLPNAQ